MDKHTLAVLEFDSLLELLAQRALSEPGRNHCKGLRPDLSSDQAGRMWKILDEARDIFELRGGPPLSDLPDPGPIISELGPEGAYLDSESLLLVNQVVTASRRVREFLQTDQEKTSLLFEIAAELPVLRDIERSISRSIGPNGEILDNASPKLARIRKDTAGLRSDIQTRLGTLMKSEQVKNAIMDDIITQRNGRYVIPVRASSVSQVPGLVHDHSASGASSYVEPLVVLDENNRLNKLKSEEKREILRILIELSRMVADNGNEICQAGELLAEIDFTFAAARLSRDQNGSTPELNQSGGLEFRSARHPLLLPQAGSGTVVPVDINLEPDNRIMVISGINTGGKTVALKTAGLLCLMAQAGLHIPVGKGSSLRFFENILADIGDEQDIASNLSTFSGHIKRLGAILEEAGPETLVLLDELGTGTDPSEGAALALALLDQFQVLESWVMASTHFHLVKAYAHKTDGLVNAAVRTDTDGKPIFKLDYGTPGFSDGLGMARTLGLDPELVARAESYIDEGQRKTQELLASLNEERAGLLSLKEAEEALHEELSLAVKQGRQAKEEFDAAKTEEIKEFRGQAAQAIIKAEAEFRRILGRLTLRGGMGGKEISEFHEAKRRLTNTIPTPVRNYKILSDPKVGDKVLIASLGVQGRIGKINQALKKAEIEVGGKIVKTGFNELAAPNQEFSQAPKPVSGKVWPSSFSSPRHELNVIGLTVDEVLPAVDKLIDQAQVKGLKRFSVIHGKGTGRLRDAVRTFIRTDTRVKNYHPGTQNSGGEGVTVIELFD